MFYINAEEPTDLCPYRKLYVNTNKNSIMVVISGPAANYIYDVLNGNILSDDVLVPKSYSIEQIFADRAKKIYTEKQCFKNDIIERPNHYCEGGKYEPRKVIIDWGLSYYLGNVVKYISRAGRKGSSLEDLKKAERYLKWEIERLEEQNESK